MAERAGQQFAEKKDFVGESGFRNNTNVGMVRPEFSKNLPNLGAPGMGINRTSQPNEPFSPGGCGHVEKIPQRIVYPSRPLPRGAGIESQQLIQSSLVCQR